MFMHHARVRQLQDLALRDSLAVSSLSALTLVVATLLGVRLLAGPTVVVGPGWSPDTPRDHPVVDYVPIPDPSVPGGIDGTIVDPAVVVPVDDATPLDDDIPAISPVGHGSGNPGGGNALVGEPTGGTIAPPAIPDPGVYIVHDEIPVVVRSVLPLYPDVAREAGMEGGVRVRAFVGVDGRVLRAEAEGEATVFDAPAVAAVQQWVFTPAKANGQPVAVWVRVPVVFRLR